MSVGFATFEIARSGMKANERALTVTGHNISNINTPGYVRQQAMITTGPYQDFNGEYQMGLGSDIEQIRQIRHSFLDNIYRQESMSEGYWESRNKTFQDVQTILGEPMNTGLQNVVNQFWDAWQELSKAPDSLTVRSLVRQRGEALVEQVNHVGAQIDKLQKDLNDEISVRTDEINEICKKLSDLNLKVLKVEITGDSANDFRDERNVLLDRLSKLLDVEINEMQDGQLDISIGGYMLVTKGKYNKLYVEEPEPGDYFYVPKLEGENVQIPIKNGVIKGLMEARGEVSGLLDSIGNGSPNVKADIVFSIDTSNSSSTYIANVKSSISKYVDELKKRGIDYNLRLISYDNNITTNTNYLNNDTAFINGVNLLSTSTNTGNDFGEVVNILNNPANFRKDSNRYLINFTAESIDGNEVATTSSDIDTYVDTLNALGIKTLIATDNNYFNTGFPAGEEGWNSITSNLYDINSLDYDELMTNINTDINSDVNKKVSVVVGTNNILADLRKRINAQINTLVREVNYLHRSGKTLENTPTNGEDYFVTINSAYTLQMGNIKINDNIANLNNIVASKSGARGDNEIALKIANLRNNPVLSDENGLLSTDDYYQTTMLILGTGGSEAERIYNNQKDLVKSADAQRQSITGVSMDEELSNMMKYKFAYGASSRAINVVDEMLETIITKMGLSGR